MHPSSDQLLAFRDGEDPPEVAAHVASCPACSAELERLDACRVALRNLPPLQLAGDVWPDIRARLSEPNPLPVVGIAWAAVLIVLLSISFVVLMRQAPPAEDPVVVRERQEAKGKIEPLKQKSRSLESVLTAYRSRSQVLSGRTAGTIAYLEDGLTIVDLQISLLQTQDAEPDKLLRLWQERVKLLSALVELNATRGAITPI